MAVPFQRLSLESVVTLHSELMSELTFPNTWNLSSIPRSDARHQLQSSGESLSHSFLSSLDVHAMQQAAPLFEASTPYAKVFVAVPSRPVVLAYFWCFVRASVRLQFESVVSAGCWFPEYFFSHMRVVKTFSAGLPWTRESVVL